MFTLARWITATRCVDFIDQWLDPVHRGQEAILLVLGPVDLNISRAVSYTHLTLPTIYSV